MNKINFVKCLITFLIVLLSILGLSANMYSWRTKKIYLSYFLLLWCTIAMLLFFTIYIPSGYNDFIRKELDINFHIHIIGGAVNYLSQLFMCKASIDYINNSKLFETLQYFDIDIKIIHSSVLLVVLKTIIFPSIIEITLILKQFCNADENDEQRLLWTTYYLYPLFVSNIIPNCLFGGFVVFREFNTALNNKLENLMKEANFLQNEAQLFLHKHFYRMQMFCNFADKLDELSEKYTIICFQTLNYMSLFTVPLLTFLLCKLFNITVFLFRAYHAIADSIINEHEYDVSSAITNGVFLVLSFLEIALYCLVANQSIEAAKETGIILKRINLDDSDVRFKQAVEKFSYQIFVIDFKIQPLGLLNIDLHLLHCLLSTVTSFLIILIQTDLSQRFSLK